MAFRSISEILERENYVQKTDLQECQKILAGASLKREEKM